MTLAKYTKRPLPVPKSNAAAVLGWLGVEFANVQRTNPGLFVPPWVDGITRSSSAKAAEVLSITDFGNVGDGRDASAALAKAYTAAKANKIGVIFCPSGFYTATSAQTFTTAVTLVGEGVPAGGIDASPLTGSSVWFKDFDGNLFTFAGETYGNPVAAGGGVRDMRIVQGFGTGTAHSGVAIRLVATATTRPTWVRLEGNVIEECFGIHRPWKYAIEVDGGAFGVYDTTIADNSTHTSANAIGAIRINGAAGVGCYMNYCYNDAAHLIIGDVDATPNVQVTDGNYWNLTLDFAANTQVTGGTYTTITNTANTSGSLRPGRLVNPFVDLSGGSTGLDVFDVPTKTWLRTP